MFGHPRRGDRRGRWPDADAHSNPQHSRDRHRIRGTSGKLPAFAIWIPTNERMSCICQQVISRTVCPSVFRSGQLMWSRDVAAKRGICAYFRVIWSCPAAGGSTSPTILAAILLVPHRRELTVVRAVATELKIGGKAPPGGRKKYETGRNHPPRAPLIVRRRAKPPSPSPSITRCRTPVAVAAGVHLFCGTGSDRRAYSRPTTRSSRWIISARPEKPRILPMSPDERPLIFCASSAS